ncbi:MAG: hypothetical protein CM15mP41_0080 [Flammeovirgaceae bacterium]|nr:MAG: hypothetical protein CM15mP41_0080 [Flammeovirgaceae bacterium]
MLMNRKYFYYLVFGFTFLTFGLVQDYIRPNYEAENSLIIYFLGVIPNFLPGIGLPSLFYVTIPEIFKPNTSIYRNRLKLSIIISMIGLIGNEFITIYTPGRGVFDWNDVVWTIIGGNSFLFSTQKNTKLIQKIDKSEIDGTRKSLLLDLNSMIL